MTTSPLLIFFTVCLSLFLFIVFVDRCIDYFAKKEKHVEVPEMPIITPYKLEA